MKAYQIVDLESPVSLEYSSISRESFLPAIEAGIIEEIIPFQCVTPKTLSQYEHLYDWRPSLMKLDRQTKENHSDTEKAGMCSHWELMKRQGETEERFLILEHDAFLLPDQLENFKYLINFILEKNVCYANIGLFMACYTFSTHCAGWMYQLLNEQKFWINGGPYGVVERLFRNYTTQYLRKRNYLDIDPTVIHPWHHCDTLGFGRKVERYFNEYDPKPKESRKTPVTQVIKKSLKVTQHHHTYQERYLEKPWSRHHYFHVID